MPYIKQSDKARIKPQLEKILMADKGQLCYAISELMLTFARQHLINKKPDYQLLSDCRAAALDASYEWQDRIMRSYENHKIRENGDVFQDFIREVNI